MLHPPLTPAEVGANSAAVAAALIGHPAVLLLTAPAVAILADIAIRGDAAPISAVEACLLAQALALAGEVEIGIGQGGRR
jgi:hypothetical protein